MESRLIRDAPRGDSNTRPNGLGNRLYPPELRGSVYFNEYLADLKRLRSIVCRYCR